jgi:hypothetical protein
MSKDLERRVEDLEARLHPAEKEPDPPETVMYKVITAEWVEAWGDTGEEHVEDAIDDWIARLCACSVTARLGSQIASYREVLIEHMRDDRARSQATHRDNGDEYLEA